MIFKFFLVPHVIAGILSIVLFWIPAFSKKGGKIHVFSGKAYVYAMWVVVVSAATMCIIRIFQGDYTSAVFLGFLSLITSKPLWLGIAILKNPRPDFWKIKITLEIMIFLGGLSMIILGIFLWGSGASILMMIFGAIGFTSLFDIRRSTRQILESNKVQMHMAEMIVTGIAAYTAFLAFGARQFVAALLSGYWSVIPWILPTVLGLITIRIMMPKYGRT